MRKKLRVFIDTSALLAGLNSPYGAAGTILAACFAHDLTAIVSPQIIEEAERNIPVKFPHLATSWAAFLLIPPEITRKPLLGDVRRAYKLLPTSDAPILASAIEVKPDAFITWNTRDFLRKEVVASVSFPILIPQQFLEHLL